MEYTRGQIRMEILSAMQEIGWTPGIANEDTELELRDVLLLMSHFSGKMNRMVEWKSSQPKCIITVNTVVEYLYAVLNNGAPP